MGATFEPIGGFGWKFVWRRWYWILFTVSLWSECRHTSSSQTCLFLSPIRLQYPPFFLILLSSILLFMVYSPYKPCCDFQFYYTLSAIRSSPVEIVRLFFREFFRVISISQWWCTGKSMVKTCARFAISRLPLSTVQLAFHPLLLICLYDCDSVVRSSLVQVGKTTWR
jgi:hypothetical protein